MYKEKPVQKVYHTISEVAKITKLPESTIRFYESKLEIKIDRCHSGRRKYTKEEIFQLQKIQCCINFGVTISGVKDAYDIGYLSELFNFILSIKIDYDTRF